jgi:hypothetical protein
MGGVDLGSSFDKMKQDIVGNKEDFELADENALEDALKTHDWYYRMSDDPRAYDKGEDEKNKISALMKKVPRARAIELYNNHCPKAWKLQSEDKHSKLKEMLKKKVREILDPKDVQAAKKTGSIVSIPSSDTQAQSQAKSAKLNYKTYGQ